MHYDLIDAAAVDDDDDGLIRVECGRDSNAFAASRIDDAYCCCCCCDCDVAENDDSFRSLD